MLTDVSTPVTIPCAASPTLPSPAPRPVPQTPIAKLVPGSPSRSSKIAEAVRRIAFDVEIAFGSDLVSLLLVGGYARGEGGLVQTPHGLAPYNDLDLVAVLRGNRATARRQLDAISAEHGRRLGVDVDFWPTAPSLLDRPPSTLFWLDVALGGYRVLSGDASQVSAIRLTPRDVPLVEASRLLANRAVGMALSNLEALGAPCHESASMRELRHLHKSVLACGDALLLALDAYAPTVGARARTLLEIGSKDARHLILALAYREAARFRLRPDRWRAPVDHERWLRETKANIERWHLSFERWRRGTPTTPTGYARFEGRILEELPDVAPVVGAPFAALRHHLRASGRTGMSRGGGGRWSHPRERLVRVAVLLAYADADDAATRMAKELLGCPQGASPADVHSALLQLSQAGG